MRLVDKIVAVHGALDDAGLDHAFGGALALAWCTERARATIDIDVNVFASADLLDVVLEGLPEQVTWTEDDLVRLRRDGQTRLWWGTTPVDLFLNTTEFHAQAAGRCRWELLGGEELPFLCCSDLAVFKAFFNRTKDWADLEEMAMAGTLDVDRVAGVLVRYLGATDDRIDRLQSLVRHG